MKKIVVSSALSALLVLPAMAFEVHNNDDTKVDIYGSIRGYVGYGESGKAGADAGYLIGIQNNSQFGVKFQKDKFKANVEWGAVEPGVDGNANSTGWRQYWGSYTTSAGTILFGKTNTPTIDNGFTNDFFNNDNGSSGFGGIATGSRKIQIQYNVAGLSLALVEDETGDGRNGGAARPNQESPRIATSYTINDDKGKPIFKAAATYKYYNSNTIQGNVPAGTSAYHAWIGYKPTFGSSFLSLMANYGKNGHLYGEQLTRISTGGYHHSTLDVAGLDAQRAGARVEFGTKLSSDMGLIIGAGYQATFGGKGQKNALTTASEAKKDSMIHSYSAFIQLPYKVSSNFTFAPQVSFYQTIEGTSGARSDTAANTNTFSGKETGVIAAARIKWDF
ncbi:hypothetical protein C6B36_04420 [Helicobacter cinaedi]|uniref:hypothetical protein n=1 Tax=Helicobacter cinaedi TaxID=213 RepID=UPI000CF0483A|nr:hypothetical protein [Helicobacter cinaedi]AWK61674.1 hypothetical protein C6B36_04420 [Helicobacter cinaedi]